MLQHLFDLAEGIVFRFDSFRIAIVSSFYTKQSLSFRTQSSRQF